jgi:hypothetical protein
MVELTKRDLSAIDEDHRSEVEDFITSGHASTETLRYIEENPDVKLLVDRAMRRIRHNYSKFCELIKSVSTPARN